MSQPPHKIDTSYGKGNEVEKSRHSWSSGATVSPSRQSGVVRDTNGERKERLLIFQDGQQTIRNLQCMIVRGCERMFQMSKTMHRQGPGELSFRINQKSNVTTSSR